jgi:hypothetical protein
MGSNLFLNALITRRNTLKSTNALESFTTTAGFVRQHATNCSLEDL